MKRLVVQYKVKAERVSENQHYIEGVFEELRQNSPSGLRYASFKQSDGLTFVHFASIETETGDNPLSHSAAFQAFQAAIRDRCDEQPVATELEEVGSYQF